MIKVIIYLGVQATKSNQGQGPGMESFIAINQYC